MRERAAWASNPSVSLAFSAKASNKSGSKLEALGYSDLRLAGGDLFDMGTTETFNPSSTSSPLWMASNTS
ncbi:hypothetical protein [Comamonas sp. JC664]|uniref:hypothetical protein n=1 Tax=Comamonas sp. JC664 TaxID=2801917 RepID=UPI00360C9B7D